MAVHELGDLRSDRALLVAVCEALARHMNGRGMWRLTFLLEELVLDPVGEGLIPEDREWLEGGVARAAGRRAHWESELARLAGVGVEVVACTDAAFPLNLRLVHDAPPVLFVQGTLVDDDRRAVASETSGARRQAEAAIAHGKPVFLPDSLVADQPWAAEMAEGPGHVTVVSRAEEITRALEDHLDLVDADSFAFA